MFFIQDVQAQLASPYPFTNNTTCSVNVNWRFVDVNCNLVSSGNTTFAPGTTNMTVPATATDIYMDTVWIGGVTCSLVQNAAAQSGCALCPGNLTESLSLSPAGCSACNPGTISMQCSGASIP